LHKNKTREVGVFYGWIILAALSAIYFFGVGTVVYGFSVIIPEIIKDMGWSRVDASLGFSILVLVLGVSGPVAAFFLRRLGAPKLMGIGGIIAMIGVLGCYNMTSLFQYYLFMGAIAVGLALLGGVACTHTITNWFARKRALALGVFMSMGGLGAFFAAPVISLLVQSTGNWRNAWLAMAAATLIGSVVAVLFVRDKPEDMGTFMDGVDPSLNSGATAAPSRVHQTTVSWEVKDAVLTMPFWITVLAAALAVFGFFVVNSQGVLHLSDKGISPITAASAIGIIGMFGAGGRLLTGVLGDRLDPRYLLSFGLALELVAIVLLIYANNELLTYACAVILGAGNGMAIVASPALVANYYGHKNYASLIGIHGMVVIVVGSSGPIVAAHVFESIGSYTPVFLSFAAVAMLPVIITLWMRPPVLRGLTVQTVNT
jgi:MFS family permease